VKVLVGCEFSGIVTRAFRDRGHEAYSCDLLPTEGNPEWHIQDDVLNHLNDGWDLGIFHPPCIHLAASGARWFKEKIKDGRQQQAIDFFLKLVNTPIPRIAIENPIGIMSKHYRKPDQITQPFWFGDPYQKATCIWLKGLVKLKPTNVVEGREQKCHKEPPSPNRWKNRSRTYRGLAEAMAKQWGTAEG
jgi:hypothetical protein